MTISLKLICEPFLRFASSIGLFFCQLKNKVFVHRPFSHNLLIFLHDSQNNSASTGFKNSDLWFRLNSAKKVLNVSEKVHFMKVGLGTDKI